MFRIDRRSLIIGSAATWFLRPSLAALAAPNRIAPVSGSISIAISLRQLDRELQACASAGRCRPEQRAFFGMTRPMGAVLNPSGDVVIVGSSEPGLRPLDIDDLVTALRSAFGGYIVQNDQGRFFEAPGVSIDPDPAVWRQLKKLDEQSNPAQRFRSAWQQNCESPMDTRIMGVPHGRMAQVMLDADYDMKSITNGTATLNVPGFQSLFALNMEDRLSGAAAPAGTGNRFWFTPGHFDFASDQAGVLLEHAAVCLKTEAQHFSNAGTLVDSGQEDLRAQEFAAAFSDRYQEIARAPGHEIYKELDDMFRWVALANIIRDEKLFDRAGFAPLYLLRDWPLRRAKIPATLPGRARTKASGSVILSTCGGVSITFPEGIRASDQPRRDPGQTAAMASATRPGPQSVSWSLA